MAFALKDSVGAHRIHALERRYVTQAIDSWSRNPAIRILGSRDADRLSIVAFMVRHGRGYLHHNAIVALLNDLFGIQARGGCSCAGPYGARLLNMDDESGEAFLELAERGYSSLKPGWGRVNFNYFIGEVEFRYILAAVHLIAVYGYALLPEYDLDPQSGLWTHRDGNPFKPASLRDLRLEDGVASWDRSDETLPESALAEQLSEGRRILEEAARSRSRPTEAPDLEEDFDRWRWFPLPHEVGEWLDRRDPATPPG